MADVKNFAVSGTKRSRRWGLVSLASACLITSALAGGKPSVTTVHLNCLDNSVDRCDLHASSDGHILVERRAIFSDQDFVSVGLRLHDPVEEHFPILTIQFSENAAKTLWETTRTNIGRTLVFIADGHVISSTNILEPIRGPTGQIVLDLSRTEAADLVARIEQNSDKQPN